MAEPERPQKPNYEQAAKDVEAIRQQLQLQVPERETTRREVPPWNPAPSPYRSLKDTYIASLSGCNEISMSDLEAVLARGQAEMTGTRSDATGDLPPARIEDLAAAAKGLAFSFDDDRIVASYAALNEKSGQILSLNEVLFPYPPSITFNKVRVHWPSLVKALQEANFDISVDGKHPAKSREPATKSNLEKAKEEFIRRMKSVKEIDGRFPSREHNKLWPQRESYSKWWLGTRVSRKMKEAWAIDHNLTESTGPAKRNSANK
jgi:hypothetical protein